MGNPYMRFLSLVDPNQASVEFHELRGGAPNKNIVYTGLSGAALSSRSSLSDESLGMITKFIPPLFALVAFNSLVLIICCIVWLVSFIRKRRVRATPRLPRSRFSRSMPMNDTSSYIADEPTLSSPGMHVYEPVSMALSEDTFVPPSPAFYSESSKLQRPKSLA
jgi:saccharopepsin